MATLVYAPAVEILIDTDREGLIDVSSDIQRGQVALTENGLHQMSCTLINARRKYDGIFTPNDRFVVRLKRLRWLLVMTGYLNKTPYFAIYPNSIDLSGFCTLKRVKNWLIDPGTQEWKDLLATQPGDEQLADRGITRRIQHMLSVADWPQEKVHIGGIPPNFLTRMKELRKTLGAKNIIDFGGVTLKATAVIEGQAAGGGGTGTTAAGTVAGPKVAQAARAAGFTGAALETIVAIGIRESHWNATAQGDLGLQDAKWGPSVGIWQIRTLKSQTGTGADRDIKALILGVTPGVTGTGKGDIDRQARAAWGISARGTNFTPWSTYKGLSAADRATARQAIAAGGGGGNAGHSPGQGSATALISGGGGNFSIPSTLGNGLGFGGGAGAAAGPNSTKLLTFAHSQLGKGRTETNPARFGPNRYDCSGFVWACYNAAGLKLPQSVSDTYFNLAATTGKKLTPAEAWKIPGAIVGKRGSGNNGHIMIATGEGPGWVYDCGSNVAHRKYGGSVDVAGLFPGFNYTNVGAIGGVGSAPDSPISIFFPSEVGESESTFYGGLRATMNDTGLLDAGIRPMVEASLRSYCAAPNGDFIAWFPDYFDQYGMAGKMVIQDIELQSFTIDWEDSELITHQFATGGTYSRAVSPVPAVSAMLPAEAAHTAGIATVEIPEIMEAIFGWDKQPASRIKDLFSDKDKILARFGARNDWQKSFATTDPEVMFWHAIQLFMKSWVKQFHTSAPMTWMPEIFPGMILKFSSFGVQAYVSGVTHRFDFESGTFTTDANITAPSAIGVGGILAGFPSGANV